MFFTAKKEQLILKLLNERGPLLGLELVKLSNNKLGRGTIYVILSNMQENGWINGIKENTDNPRLIYSITALGKRNMK